MKLSRSDMRPTSLRSHRAVVLVAGQPRAALGQNDPRLLLLSLQQFLLDPEHHCGERTVGGTIAVPRFAMLQRLRRRAVEENGHVDSLQEVPAAVRPFNDEDTDLREV